MNESSMGIKSQDQASFAERYAQMSGVELRQLQSERDSLVDAARIALDQEISKRGLFFVEAGSVRYASFITTRASSGKAVVITPDSQIGSPELPYRWGRFVGGMTVLSAIIGAVASVIQKDGTGAVVAILYGFYGFGIYEKKKWAVFILEAGSCIGLAAVIVALVKNINPEAVGVFAIVLLFWIPQTVYFWKRRDELR